MKIFHVKKFTFALALLFAIATSVCANAQRSFSAKYVFLFIGDGFSLPQRALAEYSLKSEGSPAMCFDKFHRQMMTYTSSLNSVVTDSAASGTAIAAGILTKNGCLGVDAKGRRVQSCAVEAKKCGMKVCIVSTTPVTHATPAAFYAHRQSRYDEYGIGLDLAASNFDWFCAGGIKKYDDKSHAEYCGNLFEKFADAGFKVIRDEASFRALKKSNGKVLTVLHKTTFPFFIDAEPDSLRLPEIVEKTVEFSDNTDGFFVMCEGGRIDHACHYNDYAAAVFETREFDAAISKAFAFAEKHPSETLIIVTGDHETGGLSFSPKGDWEKFKSKRFVEPKISSEKLAKLLFAENKVSALDFDKALKISEKSLGVNFNKSEKKILSKIFGESEKMLTPEQAEKIGASNERVKWKFVCGVFELLGKRKGVYWSTSKHSLLPVVTYVWGADEDFFADVSKNCDIGAKLKTIFSARAKTCSTEKR